MVYRLRVGCGRVKWKDPVNWTRVLDTRFRSSYAPVSDCSHGQRPVRQSCKNNNAGYEAMNIIRKGQIRWLPKTDVIGQVRFIERTFRIATESDCRQLASTSMYVGVWDTPDASAQYLLRPSPSPVPSTYPSGACTFRFAFPGVPALKPDSRACGQREWCSPASHRLKRLHNSDSF